jgi:septal ring factor EnvC (AmiA/AmiB activator)
MFNKIFQKNMSKLTKLAALVGVAADAFKSNQLSEVNQELAENNLNLEVAATGTIANLNQQIADLTTRAEKAEGDLTTAQNTITDLQTQLEDAADEETTETNEDRKPGSTGAQSKELDAFSQSILDKYNI